MCLVKSRAGYVRPERKMRIDWNRGLFQLNKEKNEWNCVGIFILKTFVFLQVDPFSIPQQVISLFCRRGGIEN